MVGANLPLMKLRPRFVHPRYLFPRLSPRKSARRADLKCSPAIRSGLPGVARRVGHKESSYGLRKTQHPLHKFEFRRVRSVIELPGSLTPDSWTINRKQLPTLGLADPTIYSLDTSIDRMCFSEVIWWNIDWWVDSILLWLFQFLFGPRWRIFAAE